MKYSRQQAEGALQLMPLAQAKSLIPHEFIAQHFIKEGLYEEMRSYIPKVYENEQFKRALLQIIVSSAQYPELAIAAANAISLLNGADVSLAAVALRPYGITNLRGIRIPGANLAYAIMSGLDLTGADLRGVNFSGAWLADVIVANCLMSEAKFGKFPSISFGNELKCRSIAFAPDGQFLAVADLNNIKIVRLSDRVMVRTLSGHSEAINALAFSPKGDVLVSASDDHTLRNWEFSTGKLLKTFEGHQDCVSSVAYCSDGKQIASGSSDKTVKLWDPLTGSNLQTFIGHPEGVTHIAYSPKGNELASVGSDGCVRLWDVASGQCVKKLDCGQSVYGLAYTFTENQLAVGTVRGGLQLWNVLNGHRLQKLGGDVYGLAYDASTHQIALRRGDNQIWIWDLLKDEVVQILKAKAEIYYMAYSPKGLHMAWAEGNEIQLCDTSSFQSVKKLDVGKSPDMHKTLSPSNDTFFMRVGDKIRIYDVPSEKLIKTLEGPTASLSGIIYSPNGRQLAAKSEKTISVWDISTGKRLKVFEGHENVVSLLAYSPSGEELASAGICEQVVRIWNIQQGNCVRTFSLDYPLSPDYLVYSPRGDQLACGGAGFTVPIWDPSRGRIVMQLSGSSQMLTHVAYSAYGDQLAASGRDKDIRIWNPQNGQLLRVLSGHTKDVRRLVYSPSNKHLASASEDNTIRIWNSDNGQCLLIIDYHSSQICELMYRPDGGRLFSRCFLNTQAEWSSEVSSTSAYPLLKTNRVTPLNAKKMKLDGCFGLTDDNRILLKDLGAVGIVGPQEITSRTQSDLKLIPSINFTSSLRYYSASQASPPSQSNELKEMVSSSNPRDLLTQEFFNRQYQFDEDANDLKALIDIVQEEEELKCALLQVINNSIVDPKMLIGAVNAITILNLAEVDLSAAELRRYGIEHWRGIRIPNANLQRAIMTGLDLTGSDLRGVNFAGAQLEGVVMRQALLSNLQLSRDMAGEKANHEFNITYSTGLRLAALSLKNNIFIIEVDESEQIQPLENKYGAIKCLALGSRSCVAAFSEDNILQIWSLRGGANTPKIIKIDKQKLVCLAFSPRGEYLATGSVEGQVSLWDVKTSQIIFSALGHKKGVISLAFCPKGDQFASSAHDDSIGIWNINSGQVVKRFQEETNSLTCLAYSSQGDVLASGAQNGFIRLWNLETGKSQLIKAHQKAVNSICFSPNGNQFASASADKSVKIWDGASGTCSHTLQGNLEEINLLSYGNDTLSTASVAHLIRRWNVQTKPYLISEKSLGSRSISSVYIPQKNQSVILTPFECRVYDIKKKHCIRVFDVIPQIRLAIAASPNGEYLAAGGFDGNIQIWHLSTGKVHMILSGHKGSIACIAYSPSNNLLASRSADGPIRIWDLNKGQCIKVLEGPNRDVTAINFSLTGEHLATGSDDKSIRVWDTSSWRLVETYQGDDSFVTSLLFSSSSKLLISCGHKLQIWDRSNGSLLHKFEGHRTFAYSSLFNQLATATSYNEIVIRDLSSGECLQTLSSHGSRILSINYNVDNKQLISVNAAGGLSVWYRETGQEEFYVLNSNIKASRLVLEGAYDLSDVNYDSLLGCGAIGKRGPAEIPRDLLPELSSMMLQPSRSLSQTPLKSSPSDPGSPKFSESWMIDYKEIQILETLGRGAFGEVKKARWKGKDIAVKTVIIKAETFAVQEDMNARFIEEIILLSKLKHERIVAMLGHCKHDQEIWLLMELVQRGPLTRHLLDLKSPLEWNLRVRFSSDISKGLEYLHDEGVLHLDIKSANVLLTQDWRCKLTDFGISKTLGEKTHVTTMTKMGTPAYIAPEIISATGKVYYKKEMDIYSLGILFWEIAARAIPFDGLVMMQLLMQVVIQKARPVMPRETPPSYARLIQLCWAEEQLERPNIKAVVNCLENLSTEYPPVITPNSMI